MVDPVGQIAYASMVPKLRCNTFVLLVAEDMGFKIKSCETLCFQSCETNVKEQTYFSAMKQSEQLVFGCDNLENGVLVI